MTREEMLVLAELKRLCNEAPAFALGFPDGTLPVADEYAFGFRLLDLAHGVLLHAQERTALDAAAGSRGHGPAELPGSPRQLAPRTVIEHGEPPCPES